MEKKFQVIKESVEESNKYFLIRTTPPFFKIEIKRGEGYYQFSKFGRTYHFERGDTEDKVVKRAIRKIERMQGIELP